MPSDVTLKPCPFCGGGDFVVEPEPWSWVHCDGCDANGPVTETEAEAIAAWNQRADAQGEPVAWMYERERFGRELRIRRADNLAELGWTETPLYTHPPAQDVAALVAALKDLVEEYVCNVDSYRIGGFYTDPEEEDCVINARTALAKVQQP